MAQIQGLAEAEMRSRANMMKILIVEAVEARLSQRTGTGKGGGRRGE